MRILTIPEQGSYDDFKQAAFRYALELDPVTKGTLLRSCSGTRGMMQCRRVVSDAFATPWIWLEELGVDTTLEELAFYLRDIYESGPYLSPAPVFNWAVMVWEDCRNMQYRFKPYE